MKFALIVITAAIVVLVASSLVGHALAENRGAQQVPSFSPGLSVAYVSPVEPGA